MSKQILQSVGDDTVAFDNQCYWVTENVKKILPNFQPGMEVDITVRDINGTPMVIFLKRSDSVIATPDASINVINELVDLAYSRLCNYAYFGQNDVFFVNKIKTEILSESKLLQLKEFLYFHLLL